MSANVSELTTSYPALSTAVEANGSEWTFQCAGASGTTYFIGGSVIAVIGLLLNASFIFVFCRVKYMRTMTNAYLVNLAVSDSLLLMSVCIYYMCTLASVQVTSRMINCILSYLHGILLLVSLWMITIVSIERYLGICNPLKARIFNTKGRVAALIACTWVLSIICSGPKMIHCVILESERANMAENTAVLFYLLMFVYSLVTVLCMYVLTVKNFRKSARRLGKERQTTRKSDDAQVLATCIAITVVYFICVFPSAYRYLLFLLYRATNVHYGGNFTICMYGLSRWFLLVNSSVNPLIYTITSARCRKAFTIAFWCKKVVKTRRTTTLPACTAYGNSMTTHLGTDL